MGRARTIASYAYIALLVGILVLLNVAAGGYTIGHPDAVTGVVYLVGAATALGLVEVRIDRGRLTLAALATGPAAVLLNPLNASLVGLSTGFAMARRQRWPILANAVIQAVTTAAGATVRIVLHSSLDIGPLERFATILVVCVAGLAAIAMGLSIRSGESLVSIARHNFTAPFLIAYCYFILGGLVVTYLVDGSILGYLLATIMFVLALALTDTIAGRRIRRVLESELSDADRHLFHSRAVEGVVHNLRNHMATAVGYLKEIDTNKLEPVDRDAVQTAKAAANDAVTVLQSLSQGATPRVTYAAEGVDLNQLVSLALDMARPRARPKRIELRLLETSDDVRVRADPLLLREVATNLVNNAIDAAPESGHVEIETGRRGGSPFFTIADNGSGVTEENRHHLFEPHFTTKEHGTGLGLFMSYGIIREHQGQLLYEGNRKGGVFTVVLPPFGG